MVVVAVTGWWGWGWVELVWLAVGSGIGFVQGYDRPLSLLHSLFQLCVKDLSINGIPP